MVTAAVVVTWVTIAFVVALGTTSVVHVTRQAEGEGTTENALRVVTNDTIPLLQFELPQHAVNIGPDLFAVNYSSRLEAVYHVETTVFNESLVAESMGLSTDCCERTTHIPRTNYKITVLPRPDALFDRELRRGVDDWNSVLPGRFSTNFIERSNSQMTGFQVDGANEIGFGRILSSYSSNILAITVVYYDRATKELVEWDQCYNTGRFDYGDVSSNRDGVYDIKTVVLHEMGHVNGARDLYNDECSSSLMYYKIGRNEEKKIDSVSVGCVNGNIVENDPFTGQASVEKPRLLYSANGFHFFFPLLLALLNWW